MKTFAAALLMSSSMAWDLRGSQVSGAPDGAVIVGPDAINPTVGGTVLINSGVDNNAVDAERFAAAIQGSNLIAGNVAGYLAGVRLASQLPLSASLIGTFGDRVPVATSTYVDVVEERPYTVDASTTKTITDVKKRQEPFHTTETRTDTVYTPGTVTKQRDLLVTDVEARPQTINSTSYATFGTSGSQFRTRYDVANADVDVDLLELEQGTKEVTKKDFTVEYDEVTKTRDNFITINKLCDVEYEEEVQETILVDVETTCPTTVNQPVAETVFVDKVAVGVQKVGYAVGSAVHGHGFGLGGFGGYGYGLGGFEHESVTSSPFHTSDGHSNGSFSSDDDTFSNDFSSEGHVHLGRVGLGGLRGYYGATGIVGGAHRHVAPIVAKRAVGVTVPKTVLRDNFVTVDVACVKQEEQVVTKTVTKTRKEPCTETVNYQTTVTQDIPRTNVFDVTDTVAVTTQGSRTDTIDRDIAVKSLRPEATSSIGTVKIESSRVRDNLTAVQSVVKEDFEDLTFTPSEVEVSRQNLRYKDVEKTVSYDASIEGTEVKIQEVPTQKRVLQLQTDLGPIGADVDVPGRGTNGNILVEADASFVATGGLARPIVASNGIGGDNVIVPGAVTTLGGDVYLNGGLGAAGRVFAGTGFGGSSAGVGVGSGFGRRGLVSGLSRVGGFSRFGGLSTVGGVYGRGYAAAHGW